MKVDRCALALIAVLAVPVLAGCGGSDSKKPSAAATKEALKAVDINARPRDQVKEGGTLRWAVDQFSTQWNYNELDGPADATLKILQGLMPGAFIADEHAKLTVDPNYASSAKVTSTSPQVDHDQAQPEGEVVGRQADHREGLRGAVEGDARHRRALQHRLLDGL